MHEVPQGLVLASNLFHILINDLATKKNTNMLIQIQWDHNNIWEGLRTITEMW